ncbi:MAG TPA: AMP-binding protein [Gemmatimonadaceae bacterium]|nr:AMP-binding protein [Gemmatimonadaceae bacterium]
MSEPLALLPLALAAGGGRLRAAGDSTDYETQQLVAAGLTLLQRSAPLVRALSGKRSAILLPTSPAYFTALAASEGRGAVLINPLAAPAEVAFQCADANVGALFTTSALATRAPKDVVVVLLDDAPRAARVIVDGASRDVDLGSHFGLSLEGERDVPGSSEEAAILYTSAMHGTPLGAVLTHANLLANARSTVEAAANTAEDHVLALLPFAHLFGLTVTASAPLLAGARVTTMDRFNPFTAAELLANGVTEVVGVPAVFMALLSAIERSGLRLRDSALRLCICGGAPLPRELQDRWAEATGVELRQGYGLTEGAPVCLFNRVQLPNARGTLGVPFPGVDVAIFPPVKYTEAVNASAGAIAAGAEPLTDGEPGEIRVRGPNVSPGYLHGAGAGLPRVDGWLCTGDAGRRNSDGTVTFLGVLKPMFTRNGFNIYPREIERVVCALPGVERTEVSAIPEPTRENDILLRVAGNVMKQDVERWCRQQLSAYKQPSVIELVA